MSADDFAILTDVSRCIGCEKCVQACQQAHHLPKEKPWRWLRQIDDLSSSRWTTLRRQQDEKGLHYIRQQCRHCLEPECVSVCIVGALTKSPQGPVIYDPDICIGCRYCMIACPWEIPRYSWEDTVPYVQKCDFCYERVVTKGEKPACVAACPTQATVFGRRDELIKEAWSRLKAAPNKYVQHVWGEHEVGGTSVLYISDIDLRLGDFEHGNSTTEPMPPRTTKILHKMPAVFVGMATAMSGLHWIIERRQKLMNSTATTTETQSESGDSDAAADTSKTSGAKEE